MQLRQAGMKFAAAHNTPALSLPQKLKQTMTTSSCKFTNWCIEI